MKLTTIFAMLLFTTSLTSQTCWRELKLTNWLDQYGNGCFIPVPMYKYENGQWVYVASFQNDIPQTIQVEYGGYYKWDLSFCDETTACTEFTVSEQCGSEKQIEFKFTVCPPADYKLIIDKVLYQYRGHNVCDTCPD